MATTVPQLVKVMTDYINMTDSILASPCSSPWRINFMVDLRAWQPLIQLCGGIYHIENLTRDNTYGSPYYRIALYPTGRILRETSEYWLKMIADRHLMDIAIDFDLDSMKILRQAVDVRSELSGRIPEKCDTVGYWKFANLITVPHFLCKTILISHANLEVIKPFIDVEAAIEFSLRYGGEIIEFP